MKARIDTELQTEQADHWQRLQTEITGPRYLALLADLADWVDNSRTRRPRTARRVPSSSRSRAAAGE